MRHLVEAAGVDGDDLDERVATNLRQVQAGATDPPDTSGLTSGLVQHLNSLGAQKTDLVLVLGSNVFLGVIEIRSDMV